MGVNNILVVGMIQKIEKFYGIILISNLMINCIFRNHEMYKFVQVINRATK